MPRIPTPRSAYLLTLAFALRLQFLSSVRATERLLQTDHRAPQPPPAPSLVRRRKVRYLHPLGLYPVPGWAPIELSNHHFDTANYIKNNPYAEWYCNVMRVPGASTQAHHLEQYHRADYYDFTAALISSQSSGYLNAMSRFHHYSFGNVLEIARQRAVT